MSLDNSIIRRLMTQTGYGQPEIITDEFKRFCNALHAHGKIEGVDEHIQEIKDRLSESIRNSLGYEGRN